MKLIFIFCDVYVGRRICEASKVHKVGAKTNTTAVNCGQFLRSKEKRLNWLQFDFKWQYFQPPEQNPRTLQLFHDIISSQS